MGPEREEDLRPVSVGGLWQGMLHGCEVHAVEVGIEPVVLHELLVSTAAPL